MQFRLLSNLIVSIKIPFYACYSSSRNMFAYKREILSAKSESLLKFELLFCSVWMNLKRRGGRSLLWLVHAHTHTQQTSPVDVGYGAGRGEPWAVYLKTLDVSTGLTCEADKSLAVYTRSWAWTVNLKVNSGGEGLTKLLGILYLAHFLSCVPYLLCTLMSPMRGFLETINYL